MLQRNPGPPLRISLVVPRWFVQTLLAMAGATTVVTWVLPIAAEVRGVMLLIITAATTRTVVWRFQGRYQFGYAFVVLDAQGCWWLERPNGDRIAVKLCDDTYVHPRLVVLNVQGLSVRGGVNVILWAGQCGDRVFRRLRVMLSCG
jgi:hypothetical protein